MENQQLLTKLYHTEQQIEKIKILLAMHTHQKKKKKSKSLKGLKIKDEEIEEVKYIW